MALPNVAVQQAGVDPLDIRKRQDRDQKIAEILDNIQSRLGAITNVRANVQSSVFDAFGNNFISRSISQAMDSVTDSFKSLIVGKKEEKDPILENSKKQIQLLTTINTTVGSSERTLSMIDDTLIGIRQDIKSAFEKQKPDVSAPKPVTPAAPDITDFPPLFNPPPPPASPFPLLENEPSPVIQPAPPETKVPVGAGPVEKEPPPAAVKEPGGEATYSRREEEHDARTEQILDDILSVMTKTSKSLDDLLKAVPLSTAEAEMESELKKKTLASRVEDPSKVEDAPPPGSNKFDWSRLITGWFDLDANMKGIMNVIKMVTEGLKGAFTLIRSISGSLLPAIGTIAAAAAPLAVMYGVTKWAETASIHDEEGNLTGTGEFFDTAQKVVGNKEGLAPAKPITQITADERIAKESETSFFGLSTSSRDAFKKRYLERIERRQEFSEEEAAALKKHFDITVPEKQIVKQPTVDQSALNKAVEPQVEVIDKKQKEVAGAEKKAGAATPAMNVNNNSVVNNQTIMPTRTVVKNPDDSFNNYLNSILA